MVPYNKDKQPTLAPWTANNSMMNASVVLDQRESTAAFTNLDEISGRAVIRCGKSADVSAIVVKLEGESRTRLLSPGGGPNNDRPRPQLEYHKILYKTQTVFPPPDVMERTSVSGKQAYTLPPGEHEYPFNFKLPFNNVCFADRSPLPTVSMSGAGLEFAKPAPRHVKKTLPPTLGGFPGEAEIRYFIKVTVVRSSMFKENARGYTPFNFMPIEPPRPTPSGSEVFARQKHTFNPVPEAESLKAKLKATMGEKQSVSPASTEGPHLAVDARLPEPAIMTCNSNVPLRILIKKLNSFTGQVYLSSLQISLLGHTLIRAHEVHRNETNSWIIMTKSNMDMPIGSASDPVETEMLIDDSLWKGIKIPNTVAPSFETCNITRTYQVDIRVGLKYGGTGKSSKAQTIILPLRLDTKMLSGIAPPPELISAMAEARTGKPIAPPVNGAAVSSKLQDEGRRPSRPVLPIPDTTGHTNAIPITPTDEFPPAGFPSQSESSSEMPPEYSEAPPSYEDAVATNLPPVNAPRPDYAPPATGEDEILNRDEKRGWGRG